MLETKLTDRLLHTTSVYIQKLHQMGIVTVRDLLEYFPRNYEDRSHVRQIHEIDPREVNIVQGKITQIENLLTRGHQKITRAELEDKTGNIIECVWFNRPHLPTLIKKDREYILSGKVKLDFGKLTFQSPEFEEIKPEQIHMGRIIPVYPEYDTGAKVKNTITTEWLRNKMHLVIPFADEFAESLPQKILDAEKLLPLSQAIRGVHFPTSVEQLQKARHRLSFDDLFFLQLEALKRKYDYQLRREEQGKAIPLDAELVKQFVARLPFHLTDSQRIVTYQIFKDMEKKYPMIRLLEGDVGSGKTIVATIAAYHTLHAGYQVAFMVPTEVLARQHFENITKLFADNKPPAPLHKGGILRIELLIGSLPKKEKEEITVGLQDGSVRMVIGTHALIQEHIAFHNLGFVVIDEQHRFGVEQRKKLASFGHPHVLHMTATPIPRTLALTMYGDQDLSILKEMPRGRIPIVTRVVPNDKREQSYRFIESEIEKGRQVYVICPLISESDKLAFKAVTEEYKRLKKDVFAKYEIGLLHGQLKSEEKEKVMHDFATGKIQLLVSTTVIEVGIDVKNATIMMIEGADRFGLSQLHQLRGRVGRGEAQSYCFLFTDSEGEDALARLRTLEQTNNGFEVAEKDLQLRGAGEIYGLRQSGLPDLKMADLLDIELIEKTRTYAEQILEEDSDLKKYPVLRQRIAAKGEWVVS